MTVTEDAEETTGEMGSTGCTRGLERKEESHQSRSAWLETGRKRAVENGASGSGGALRATEARRTAVDPRRRLGSAPRLASRRGGRAARCPKSPPRSSLEPQKVHMEPGRPVRSTLAVSVGSQLPRTLKGEEAPTGRPRRLAVWRTSQNASNPV